MTASVTPPLSRQNRSVHGGGVIRMKYKNSKNMTVDSRTPRLKQSTFIVPD